MPITFPMLFDEMDDMIGATFEVYESGSLLPSIFLVDQTGTIVIRSDGIAINPAFEEELEHILTTIDDLLANPPGGF